jgi:hypothetical protein
MTPTFIAATVLLALVATVAADGEEFALRDATAPLAELLAGRWRADVITADLTNASKASLDLGVQYEPIADEPSVADRVLSAIYGAVGASRSALKMAVRALYPDEPGFVLELAPALLDGVLVGHARLLDGGRALLRDVYLSGAGVEDALPEVDFGADSDDDGAVPKTAVTVECSSLTSCKVLLGTKPAEAEGATEAAAPTIGELGLQLQYRPRAQSKTRQGFVAWNPAATAADGISLKPNASAPSSAQSAALTLAPLKGVLTVMTNKHALVVLYVPDRTAPTGAASMRAVRLTLRRETDDVNHDSSSPQGFVGWLAGSWTHVLGYSLLFLVVVGGKFGTKYYFKWRGVDIEPWLKAMRGGKRVGKPTKKKLPSDAEIHAMMARDDEAERNATYRRRTAAQQQQK